MMEELRIRNFIFQSTYKAQRLAPIETMHEMCVKSEPLNPQLVYVAGWN